MEHLMNVYASKAAKGSIAEFLGFCEVAAHEANYRLTEGLWLVRDTHTGEQGTDTGTGQTAGTEAQGHMHRHNSWHSPAFPSASMHQSSSKTAGAGCCSRAQRFRVFACLRACPSPCKLPCQARRVGQQGFWGGVGPWCLTM